MDVMVEGTRALQVQKLLRDRDIQFEVTATNTGPKRVKSPVSVLSARPKSGAPRVRLMDWRDFYPLNVIYNTMDYLEKLYPSVCTVMSIGQSVEGRDIKILKISNSDARNTAVWIDGGTHAREWITTATVAYIADYLVKNFSQMPEYVTNKNWYLLPVLNPDGYIHTHTYDRMWRKNRARVGSNIVGVDLNRNFGYYWGRSGTECSSDDPNHINYRGPEAFSEPETAAVKDMILYCGTPFKIFLTFHAYSEVISFPWCFTADPCADYVNLLEGGTAIAKAMYQVNGRMYKVGDFKDVMYYATGTSIDWSYGIARIPFSYLMELPSKQHKFFLPKNEIIDCCKEALSGVLALAEFVDKKKCLNCNLFYKNSK